MYSSADSSDNRRAAVGLKRCCNQVPDSTGHLLSRVTEYELRDGKPRYDDVMDGNDVRADDAGQAGG